MSIGAPDPERLDDFYREIGLIGGERSWGTADRPGQIRLAEAPYRQLLSIRILCEDEADLARAATRLDALGVGYRLADGRLTVRDPVNEWTYIVEPGAVADVSRQPQRAMNFPGERNRLDTRAEVIFEETPRAPRRLGHVVIGTPEPPKTAALCEAIGRAGLQRLPLPRRVGDPRWEHPAALFPGRAWLRPAPGGLERGVRTVRRRPARRRLSGPRQAALTGPRTRWGRTRRVPGPSPRVRSSAARRCAPHPKCSTGKWGSPAHAHNKTHRRPPDRNPGPSTRP